MSTNLKTYLGVLITIPEKYIEKEVYDCLKCTNCGKKSEGKYCPSCGSSTEITYKLEKEYLDLYSELDDNNFDGDFIWKPSYSHYHILNEHMYFKDDDAYIFDNKFNVENEINKFKTTYSKEIEFIEKTFGEIKIEFGILNYWN